MIRLKRTYQDFYNLIAQRGLDVFFGDIRHDSYHLLALDNQIIYECYVPKDGSSDHVNFEQNHHASIGIRKQDNPEWDEFTTSFPTNSTELHTYKKNNVKVMEVTIIYDGPSKSQIIRIQKTRF